MRTLHSSVTLLAAAAMFGAASIAQAATGNQSPTAEQSSASNQSSGTTKPSPTAPEGFVIVDEQLITLTANEPQNHFLRAHEYMGANDPRAAAAEIRIAASYLDMQASRKGDADRQGLNSAASDLRHLADQMAKKPQGQSTGATTQPGEERANAKTPANGNTPANGSAHAQSTPASGGASEKGTESAQRNETDEIRQTDHAFSRAQRALALHFQEEAKREIGAKKPVMAGEDLDSAATALSASFAWSRQQCPQECSRVAADVQRLSAELLTPAGQAQPNSGSAQDSSGKNNTDNQAGEAQPAAARLSADSSASSTNRIPADAEKIVDEFGKSIQGLSNGSSTQPGQTSGEHASAKDASNH